MKPNTHITFKICTTICLLIGGLLHCTQINALNLGKTPQNAISIFPAGFHTDEINKNINFKFLGISYKDYTFSSFENSFKDRTYSIGINKNIFSKNNVFIGYTVGILYGYDGRLSTTEGVPFRKTFLFKGDINPFLGLNISYQLTKKLEFATFIEPLVIIYGFKFLY
jgi:hypothetical protein